ncbi:MAG TPA: hypothetical protein VLH79_01840 [Chthonomonadales bacterium]|nr:hypothetical protein [Chthonomonadales bacterium]
MERSDGNASDGGATAGSQPARTHVIAHVGAVPGGRFDHAVTHAMGAAVADMTDG